MDFTFSFDDGLDAVPVAPKINMEYWVPIEEEPILRPNEIQSLWHGEDVIESLHLVKTAFLYMNEEGKVAFDADSELDFYFLAAKLKKAPYMVIMDHYQKNSGYEVDTKNCYYIDLFYAPNFGTLRPKYMLFQKVSISAIPDTMVLFREI